MGKWQRKPPSSEAVIPEEQVRQIEQEIAREEAVIAREEAVLAEEIRELTLLTPTVPYIPPLPVNPEVIPTLSPACTHVATHVYALSDASILYIFDQATGALQSTVSIGNEGNSGIFMTYDAVQRKIYLSGPSLTGSLESNEVYVFDNDLSRVTQTIIGGADPMITGVDPVHDLLYIPNANYDQTGDGSLYIVDAATGALIATVTVGTGNNSFFAWPDLDNGAVYILTTSPTPDLSIWRMDAETYALTLVTTYEDSGLSFAVADLPRGKIYILEFDVIIVDLYTGNVQHIPIGLNTGILGIDPVSGLLLLASPTDVYTFNPATSVVTLLASITDDAYLGLGSQYSVTDNIFYVATYNGYVYGYDITTGEPVFTAFNGMDPDEPSMFLNVVVGASCED
jgi:outer membrane protein assembly factor BamB